MFIVFALVANGFKKTLRPVELLKLISVPMILIFVLGGGLEFQGALLFFALYFFCTLVDLF